ncbi:MAG: hypothetical protein HY913_17615 [Desulfomonile tiedjei]|nr:hypothetical protein [Desulfomonile tiedjei]
MVIIGLFITFSAEATSKGTDILGLHLDTDQTEVVATLAAKGITPTQQDEATLTAKSLPVPIEGLQEAKCLFKNRKLYKVTLFFEIPPHEASAATLIQRYENEKGRLGQQFGPPSKDVTAMDAPSIQDRYDWLKRGRGYYLSVWDKAEDKLKVTLWLYGADADIVLMETYERP